MDAQGVITTVVLDTADLEAAEQFWTSVLELKVVHRAEPYVYLSRICASGPHLALQKVPERKAGKNRLHFDIRVPDRSAMAARVVELGGRVLGEHQEGDLPVWTVVADSEGNEFCIYQSSTDS